MESIPGCTDFEERVTVVEDIPSKAGHRTKGAKDRCWLTLLAGPTPGAIFRLEGPQLTIGRSHTADVHISHQGLSRLHARLFRTGNTFFIEDLNSANGTFVRGKRVVEPVRMADGDRVQLGRSIIFKIAVQDALEEQAALRVYGSSVRDALTGLYNRHFFQDRYDAEFAFARRHGAPLTVMMLDVDFFKSVNDTHGHQAGDAVLRSVGAALKRMTRKEDVTARYGGEEFVLLVRGVPEEHATQGAERLRRGIEALEIPWQDARLGITTSVGVATMSTQRVYSSPSELLAAADLALYRAKQEGRNRVAVA
jgi:diguanylate cyclase (GGDEF)-like protein